MTTHFFSSLRIFKGFNKLQQLTYLVEKWGIKYNLRPVTQNEKFDINIKSTENLVGTIKQLLYNSQMTHKVNRRKLTIRPLSAYNLVNERY